MLRHGRTPLHALATALVLLTQAALHAQTIRDETAHFSIELPDNWSAMPADYIKRVNDNISYRMPHNAIQYTRGFMLKGAKDETYPYILVQYMPGSLANVSYEELERTLSKSIGSEVKSVENAISDIGKNLTMGVPVLDRTKNVVLLRVQMDIVGAGKVQGISVGHLSSAGNVMFHSYALDADFQKQAPVFNQINDSLQFDPGFEFKPGTGGILGNILRTAGNGAIIGGIAGGVGALLVVLLKKRQAPKPPYQGSGA